MNAVIALEAIPQIKSKAFQEEPLFEIVGGQKVEMPPMSSFAVLIATRLVGELYLFMKSHPLGHPVMEDIFHLPLPVDRNRRPDVAFVSYERWSKDRPRNEQENAWGVVPDLAVEVISPHDLAEETMDKIHEYFQAGVRLVWVVYPRHRLVHVYESLTSIHVLTRQDYLDGGAVLPGFRLPLKEIFVEEVPATP